MIAVFTYHNSELEKSESITFQSQGIAYSTDKGRTWTKYSGNPVLPNPGIRDFRDPKVLWHAATGKWIMIIAVHDRVHIYSSTNLKSWSFESEFGEKAGAHGGVWECPDLFPLKAEGSEKEKWVMLVSINPGGPNGGSATQYFTGQFDGHSFIPDVVTEKWIDWGTDNYAGVTWSGIADDDGRRLFIGWMSNWNYATVVPTITWRSAMTIPRELSLISENGNFFVISRPVDELRILRKTSESLTLSKSDKPGQMEIPFRRNDLNCCELIIDLGIPFVYTDSLGVILANDAGDELIIGYSVSSKQIFIDRTRSENIDFSERFEGIASAPYDAGDTISMHLFLDASSVELFIDEGKLVMSGLFFPVEEYTKLRFFSNNPESYPEIVKYYKLESIWPNL
jgi:fructan beta-fructosidase